ncbi:putative cobalt transporter subunit CbtA (plasmid) [Caballeronia sp. SBC1]|uniref:CbtA family protein n=1 Tax=unclassified Caballeronia TaxID=2646786 RepID=UPI0013E1ED54|nr:MULTISPECIES: CbtA family protein [unclassified Caballeronia]QIE28416.1 putative cobalt transporter subunit CbtA [Caballeronia sp. SBC2]QIN66473.1 putative cobalt transporter subunit CbtA [Caballeronia sp. SBC1]
MIRNLLIRGMIAGLVAGLLGFCVAKTFGEPSVDRAIAFETQQDKLQSQAEAAAGHQHDPADDVELVSRATQAGLGLLTGVCVFGTALGGLFSLVFALSYARLGALRARGTSALLGLFGFVAVAIVPFLKYPPNPPSVGNPDTIGARTALFFGMVAISLIVAVFAVRLQRRLKARHGDWNAVLISVAVYIVLMALAYLALPPIDEVPKLFSATLLWNFRVAAIGIQAVIWATLGLLFGVLAQRELERAPSRRIASA